MHPYGALHRYMYEICSANIHIPFCWCQCLESHSNNPEFYEIADHSMRMFIDISVRHYWKNDWKVEAGSCSVLMSAMLCSAMQCQMVVQ